MIWAKRILSLAFALVLALAAALPFAGAETVSTRWADAADAIDKYLDAAFEAYLDGDASLAYQHVNDGYFEVYEVTGFERQTMSYISGVRKNAVEMQFSSCKAAVKKENADREVIVSVRAALTKLKTMIREDGNKLAAQQGGAQSEMKYFKRGEPVSTDPYPEYSADPDAAAKYASWYEAATLVKELLDTAYMGYLDKDFAAAEDNLNTAYYSVYEESGLAHKIYTDLSLRDRQEMEAKFETLRGFVQTGETKYQKNKYRTTTDTAKQLVLKKAKALDEKAAAEKAAEASATGDQASGAASAEPQQQTNPQMLTFLGAFGIIVREGLEAILVISAIIAYLVKSGNAHSLKNVYIGAILGIVASFIAAAILAAVKQAVAGAGMAQELIEGITALIAVCVLFYVSNWMISKAEAAAWSGYIGSKVQSSVERRSSFTLAFTAFLSVFREGAEVVLFYQPMLQEGNAGMVAGLRRRLRGAGVCLSGHYKAVHPPADQGLLHRHVHPHGCHVRSLPGQRDQGTGRGRSLRPDAAGSGHPGKRRDPDLRYLSLSGDPGAPADSGHHSAGDFPDCPFPRKDGNHAQRI